MFGKTKHIHFVGIGGIGMSGLAIIMRNLKFEVSGSDLRYSEITKSLERNRIKIQYRHKKEAIAGADVVVFSTAVTQDNPELMAARRKGIPVIHRSELLAELTRMKIAICISGTHGKTTTTSIVGEVLDRGKLAPTTVVGGIIRGKRQAQFGKGDYLVCEADESDKSFLKLFPSYVIITNIEAEHLDHYRDLHEIKEHFTYFANHAPFWGATFLCSDSPGLMDIRDKVYRRVITYGFNETADIRAMNARVYKNRCSFDVVRLRKTIGRFSINLLGRHNMTNALAAIGIGLELNISTAKIRKALREFGGVHRRIEYLGDMMGIKLFDDYGHHPTEVAVTLQTIREYYPKARIISVFQPHRYTRTHYLFDEFARAFLYADIVLVTDIYAAHEIPIPGVSGEALAKRISKEQSHVYYMPSLEKVITFIRKTGNRGDIVVVQGAGDINKLPGRLKKELS